MIRCIELRPKPRLPPRGNLCRARAAAPPPDFPGARTVHPSGGWSLLEFVLVVVLIAILMLVAIDRLLPMRADAEAASVLRVEGALRAAIGAEVTARVLRERGASLLALQGDNPMALLAEKPTGYLGARPRVDAAELPRGGWAFDAARGELVYRLRYPEALVGALGPAPHVRWRMDLHPQGIAEAGGVRGVVLARVGDWRWHLEVSGSGPDR